MAVALISMVSGCQNVDATKTASLNSDTQIRPLTQIKPLIKPAVHARRSVRAPVVQATSTLSGNTYAFAAPQPLKADRPAPVKVSYGNGGPFLGSSPYICGPSGFGQRATCRARF